MRIQIFAQLVLPYELRENSRLRTALASGEEVAIFTARGTVLRNNDLLKGDDGRVVQIVAAEEPTYRITCNTPHDLLRCAFHLGNRHTQTQVGEGFSADLPGQRAEGDAGGAGRHRGGRKCAIRAGGRRVQRWGPSPS